MDSLLASTNVTLLYCVLLLTLVGFLLTIWLVIELTFLRPFAHLVKVAHQYRTQDNPIQFTYKPHSEIGEVMRFIEKLTKGIHHGQANIDRLVAIREYDSAGRWADNEFLIVIRSESYNSLLALSKRLTELSSNSVGAENSTSIDLSIGGALINGGCSITEALAKADTALYMAKQSKECQVYIWQEGSHVA
ncbi:diguanylate cyclase [Vibrio sp. SA48]